MNPVGVGQSSRMTPFGSSPFQPRGHERMVLVLRAHRPGAGVLQLMGPAIDLSISLGRGNRLKVLLQPQESEVHHVGYVEVVVRGIDGVGESERNALGGYQVVP